MCFTAFLNLNTKYCQEYKQEGGQKVDATESARFHNTLWNEIGLGRTSENLDGLIRSVFAESLTLALFYDSDAQIQTIFFLYYRSIPS